VRRIYVDSKTFDSVIKLSASRTGRRRLFQAAAAVGIGGLLTRGGVEEVLAKCKEPREQCNSNGECQCKDGNFICGRLSRKCNKSGDRCCGTSRADCKANCDCCKGFSCNRNGKCSQNA
jgi:hypothetical protein